MDGRRHHAGPSHDLYYTAHFREVIRQSSSASMDELARQTFGLAGFLASDRDSIREIEGHHWPPLGVRAR